MDDNQRTALVVGVSLVGLSVFTGLLFVVYVLSGEGPAPSSEPAPPPAPEPAPLGGPMSMQTDLDRLVEEPVPLATAARDLVGDNGVICSIAPSVDVGSARLSLAGDNARGWLAVAAARRDVLLLTDIPEEGEGTLFVEGYAPTAVRWFDARDGRGGCDPDPVTLTLPEASVIGSVEGFAEHGPNLSVEACGQPVTLDGDGGFFVAAVPDEACEVVVRRHFGVWEYRDTVSVTPERDEELEVTLEVPGFQAVLPVKVADGAIVAVWDDGEPAVEAGRDVIGARVTSVDGASVPGDADGFHLATGGPLGSVATVEIERGGVTERIELRRRAMSFDDWLVR